MFRLRFLLGAALAVALAATGHAPAHAAIDVAPPALASFTFTPSSLNVTGGSDQIVISARLTDATAVVPPDFTIDSDGTTQAIRGQLALTSGTTQDGIFSATVTIPATVASGTWTVSLDQLEDTIGNSTRTRHNHATKLSVTSAGADTAAPALASYTFTPSSPATLNVTTGPKQVTVTARVTDATGVEPPTAKVSSDTSTQSARGNLTLISGTAQDGTYQGTVDIPATAAPGSWTVALDPLTDTVGNAASSAHSHATKLTVVSNATDTTAPGLASFSYTPTTVNASVDLSSPGGAEVEVEARVTDASGAVPPVAVLSSDTTAQTARGTLSLVSGTPQNGTYRGTVSLPSTAAPGLWTVALDELRDPLGNTDRTVHKHATKLTVVNDDGPSAPSAPTGVTAVRGDKSAQVSWTAASPNRSPITGYTITASPGGITHTVGGGVTTGTVTGLTNGIAYTFTVKATNAVGSSPPSAPSATVTPAGIPTAPSEVTATRGDRSVRLTWKEPVVNGSPITAYTITTTPSGPVVTVPGTQTFGTVTGLTNGNAYRFTVRATNAIGTSPASDVTDPVTPSPVPTPPATVNAVRGDKSAQVSWTAAAANGSAITAYTVTASPGGITKSVSGSTLSTSMTGLTNGTAYTFTVMATNATGTSPPSAPSAPVTPASAPAAPTLVTATRGDKSAQVTWTAANDNGSPVTTYTVTASPGGAVQTVPGTSTTVVFPNLTNGTAYTFTVRATTLLGVSPESLPSAAVTPAAAPGAPTSVVAVRGDRTARVSWTEPNTNGAPILSYTVTTNPGGGTVSISGTATNVVVPGLSNSASYTFTVTATNAVGTSAASAPSPVLGPASAPSAPTGVTADRGPGSAEISWAEAKDNGAPITSYLITANPGGATLSVSGYATSATMDGLTNGTAYTFTVRAENAIGTSPTSAASNSVVPAGSPGRVGKPTARVKKKSVTITWKAPSANGAAITGYTVSAPGGPRSTVSGNSRSVRFTGLKRGTYTFVVTARNEVGVSSPSRSVKVRIR